MESCTSLRILNEEVVIGSFGDQYEQDYRYNYLIQITLTCLNGLAAVNYAKNVHVDAAIQDPKTKQLTRRSRLPIATAFLSLKHFTNTHRQLKNSEEAQISDALIKLILERQKNCIASNGFSMTYIPSYDVCISDSLKYLLSDVCLHPTVKPKIDAFKSESRSLLIKHMLKKSTHSQILTNEQFSSLAEKMSVVYRQMNWRLLYRMSENGTSMITF